MFIVEQIKQYLKINFVNNKAVIISSAIKIIVKNDILFKYSVYICTNIQKQRIIIHKLC